MNTGTFTYYPINEVVELLHGRKKAVNTLRELQNAGLEESQKAGAVENPTAFTQNPDGSFGFNFEISCLERRTENHTPQVR